MLTPVNGCVSFRITPVGVTCNPAHMLKCRNHCGLCLFHSTSSVVFFLLNQPCHASRSLRNIERRYSQTEKEALAFVWVCKRFSIYVCGKKIELKTDHKLVERITSPASKRIEKWE